MNKKIVHDALILTAFTLVLGFLLGVVYDITKEPIAAAQKAALDEAYKVVFADAQTFEEDETFDAAAAAELIGASEFSKDEITAVNKALDGSGNVLGYVINVTSHEGSQADISFSVGIQNDGTLTDIPLHPSVKHRVLAYWYRKNLFIPSLRERQKRPIR